MPLALLLFIAFLKSDEVHNGVSDARMHSSNVKLHKANGGQVCAANSPSDFDIHAVNLKLDDKIQMFLTQHRFMQELQCYR